MLIALTEVSFFNSDGGSNGHGGVCVQVLGNNFFQHLALRRPFLGIRVITAK